VKRDGRRWMKMDGERVAVDKLDHYSCDRRRFNVPRGSVEYSSGCCRNPGSWLRLYSRDIIRELTIARRQDIGRASRGHGLCLNSKTFGEQSENVQADK
jgi:hypothetical protein